jgi:hypothetical protein
MNTQLNLKELERKAFRSTYQDGLWDLCFGLIVICMAVFVYRPPSGYSPLNIVMMVCTMGAANLLLWAGKKFITLPRMGQVKFGVLRKKRHQTMIIVLSVVVLVQVAFLVFQLAARANPELGAKLNEFLPERDAMDLLVASIGALMVGPSMILIAYFIDFTRGYFIAIMFALAVFLMLYLNNPIYAIIIGALIALPGVVLLVRFLQKYPLRREEAPHE